jgi:membrane protease YdiL (CAAX protease family)
MFLLLAGGALLVLAWAGDTKLDFGPVPGHPKAGSMFATIAHEGASTLLLWLAAGVEFGVLGPIAEEVVFRGVLGAPLARKYGPTGAAILSSALFALGHPPDILSALSSFVVGILWMFLYMRSQSLLPSVFLHIIGNSTGFVSRYIVRSFERPAAFLLPGLALIGIMAVISSVATRRTRPPNSSDLLPWS